MRHEITSLALVIGLLFVYTTPSPATELPPRQVPAGLGVNIHFVTPKPHEVEKISAAGFKWVRMDFAWNHTEKSKGVYDFSSYDGLISALEAQSLHAIFILDYTNPLYDGGVSPTSVEAQKAFAAWAVAAVRHFHNHGVIWEIYNEPNQPPFWRPRPNPDAYVRLALLVSKRIREASSNEIIIGPASARIDFPFLETCFRAGLLSYWSGISVHPYRDTGPETVIGEYQRLRELILKYTPKQQNPIPIISGEWGYSAATKSIDQTTQAKLLSRMFLTNLSMSIPLSVWYDWQDDGLDERNPEHHFGTISARSDLATKPAYQAVKTLTTILRDFVFSRRIVLERSDDYLLQFSKGNSRVLVAWTTGAPHQIRLPAPNPASVRIVQHDWSRDVRVSAAGTSNGLTLPITDAPQFVIE